MSLWLGKAHLQTFYVEAIFYRILLHTYHDLFINFSRKIKIFHTKFYHQTAEPYPLMMEIEENAKLKSIQIDWNWDQNGSNNSSGSRTCDFSTVLSNFSYSCNEPTFQARTFLLRRVQKTESWLYKFGYLQLKFALELDIKLKHEEIIVCGFVLFRWEHQDGRVLMT